MDGKVIIETELGTKSFDKQIEKLEDELEGLVATYEILAEDSTFNMQSVEAIKLKEDIEKVNNRLIDMRKKQSELNGQPFEGIKNAINNIGSGIEKTIHKVTRWGLAVFGVRGAYMFVRQAMSTLSQTDDGLATKLEYIRWALATTIKPVIEWIVNAVFKILSLFGALIKMITGYNIFAKATTKNFEKMKKSTGAIKKNTGGIKKDLYGWDEMTRVSESSGAFGGGGGLGDDIQDAIDKLPNLQEEVEKAGINWKKFFLGNYDSVGEVIKDFPNVFASIWVNLYQDILKPYLIDPWWKAVKETYGPTYEYIKNNFFEPLKNEMKPVIDKTKNDLQPIVDWVEQKIINPIKEKFSGLKKDLSDAKNNFLQQFAPFLNTIIDWLNNTFGFMGVHIDRIDDKVDKSGNNITKEIGGSLKDVRGNISELTSQDYTLNISKTKLDDVDDTLGNLLDNMFEITKKTWNIQTRVTTSGNPLKDWYNNTLRPKLNTLGLGFPRLAKGGIINQPSRGVPLALGGERGQEGVIPLTDSQQMELLGEAIGRYITINANVTNTMNGRIISRELQKIQNESNFASNR